MNLSYKQLKNDILNEAIVGISSSTSEDSTSPNANEAYSDPPLPTNGNDSMSDNLLKNISGHDTADDSSANQDATTAHSLCENELYHLLLGNDFKMRMQDNNSKVYNCPLSW